LHSPRGASTDFSDFPARDGEFRNCPQITQIDTDGKNSIQETEDRSQNLTTKGSKEDEKWRRKSFHAKGIKAISRQLSAHSRKDPEWKEITTRFVLLRALRGEFFSSLDRRPEVASHIPPDRARHPCRSSKEKGCPAAIRRTPFTSTHHPFLERVHHFPAQEV
jgi:hypothetical protein